MSGRKVFTREEFRRMICDTICHWDDSKFKGSAEKLAVKIIKYADRLYDSNGAKTGAQQ